VLTVNGTGAGELLPELAVPHVQLRLEVEAAPHLMPTHAAILTETGELVRWTVAEDGLRAAIGASAPDWVLAIAWSEESEDLWAVSAPIWVGRP
jgi:hypothetical protein